MSRQEIKAYGKQEFGNFPLVTLDPLPKSLHDYIQNNLKGKGGVHIKNTSKHLVCEKTAKSYTFWNNVNLHYKKLAPLYGKTVEMDRYICPHDNWLFSHRDNLKLHNKVLQFEQTVATQVERMLNLNNSDWVPPCDRPDRQLVDDSYEPKGKKKSRFLKNNQHQEPMKIKLNDSVKEDGGFKKLKKEIDETSNEANKKETEKEDVIYGKNQWPYNPDDLPPIPRPKPKNVPAYYGWTHSDDADSWFLEAHTPSMHEPYEKFYHNALKQKIICPKLYLMTFGTA